MNKNAFNWNISDDELISLQHRCRNSSPFFNYFILPNMFYEPPAKVHGEVCRLMDDPKIKILLIVLPRNFAKTTICQGYLLQQVVNLKHKVILYVGDTGTQAELHTEAVRAELESNDRLIALYGTQKGAHKWGAQMYTTTHGVTVIPKGSNQSIRGVKVGPDRPSLIFLDDLENDENAQTLDQRNKLWGALWGALVPTLDSRESGKDTKIIYLGTPVHEDSVLERLFALITKMRASGRTDLYAIRYPCKGKDGNSIWPEKWPNKKIDELEKMYAEAGEIDTFYREYYVTVISPKDAPFQKDDTHFWVAPGVTPKRHEEVLPDDLFYHAGVDVAFKEGRSNDYSAICVVGVSGTTEKAYVVEAIRRRLPPDKLLELLLLLNDKYLPIGIYLQKVNLDEFFAFYSAECLKENEFLPFEHVKLSKGKGGKPRRISSLQPLHLTGQLVISHDQTDLQSELYSFPRSAHDDLSDILATIIRKVLIPLKQAKLETQIHDPFSYEAISAELRLRNQRSLIGGVHSNEIGLDVGQMVI